MDSSILQQQRQVLDGEGRPIDLWYGLVEEPLPLYPMGTVTYGVMLLARREDWLDSETVRDITTDRQKALDLCALLAEMEATPLTLRDIVQDYIENQFT